MPIFTVPIDESNDCHSPAGSPAGGQFCSDDTEGGPDGYRQGHPSAQAAALAEARVALMRASFASDAVRETMLVVDEAGAHPHSLLTGDATSIQINAAAKRVWIAHGPVITAHTHPGSGTFSFDDFYLHNAVNQQGRATHTKGPLTVKAMQVYAEDGSWYEIQFKRVLSVPEMAQLQRSFDTRLRTVRRQADTATTAWAQQQPWAKHPPPRNKDTGRHFASDTEEITYAAKIADQTGALDTQHRRNFRNKGQGIWAGIAAEFEGAFTYRYHLAD